VDLEPMKANSTNEIYGGPGGRDVRTKHPPSGSVSWKPCPDARRDLARFWRRVSYGDIRGLATLAGISQNLLVLKSIAEITGLGFETSN
jgi:hypothetical protein